MKRLRALPLFWQTLILLVAAVLLAQSAGFLLLVLNPPPRPQFYRLSDIAILLRTGRREADDHDHYRDRDRPLTLRHQAAAPTPQPHMISDAALTHALAERVGVPDAAARLFFEPERPPGAPFRRWPREPVSVHHGEALFFTPVVVGVADRGGWRVAVTPAPPLIAPWQRRIVLWLAIIAVALVPLAWIFARALTRPIDRLSEAAERLGRDPQAPPVAEEGPAELRTTARALNGMQARIADYVGERTEMIGAIAHDLRTPLARIAFRVEAAPEPMREKVLADVEQMRAMLAATIGFVRNTRGPAERRPVDLAALLDALADRERDLGRAVTLGTVAPAIVAGDPLALERMSQNLIDNGVAYAGAVELSLAHEGNWAEMRFADRGPGLADAMLARAFQPFVRGDPSRSRATGGIGLGLTIARAIAEDHGGTVTLANREGGGLVATVRLPLA